MKSLTVKEFFRTGRPAGVVTAALTAAAVTAVPQLVSAQAERPNIVFILADDLGPDGFGCYGSERFAADTPRIDSLAANGIRFTRAYCTGICSPTRAQYLSGQYPFRNGVVDIDGSCDWLNTDKPVLTLALRDAGYITGGAGKSVNDGWTYYIGNFKYAKFIEEFIDGDTSDYWNVTGWNLKGPSTINPDDYAYFPDAMHAFALDFIDRNAPSAANGYKPFYFYYSLINPHAPILKTPDSDPLETNLQVLYRDNIKYIDKVVGGIVDKLDALGILDTTLLIVTGDNGSLSNYQSQLWDPDASAYRSIDGAKADRAQNREGTALVPLIVHWPAVITVPAVRDDLVDFTDLLPTFADVAGATLPAEWILDGQSIAPLLRGGAGWTPREWIYHQLQNNWCVRGTDYRLNRDGRLFDMSDAPFSMTEILPQNDTLESAAARVALQAVLDEFDPANGETYEWHQDNAWNNPALAWKKTYFKAYEICSASVSGDRADPDGDGVPNIYERAFGWHPKQGTDNMPEVVLANGALQVTHPAAVSGSDVAVSAAVTSNLVSGAWDSASAAIETTGTDPLTRRDRTTTEDAVPSRFMKIQAGRITAWPEP